MDAVSTESAAPPAAPLRARSRWELLDRLPRPLSAAWRWLPRGRSLPLTDWKPRHRWLVGLLWAHAVALPLYGIARGYSVPHSLAEGGVIAALAAAATFTRWPPRWRAAFTALGLVVSSGVLVHFSGGLIEAHFHFFVVILVLALYEDWIPFLISLAYVVLHHGVAGQLSPESVYNHPDALANPWKWAAIHGAFVAAAAVGAVVSWRLNENARARAAEATARAVRSHEANEMKSRFVATTSHELRTPLTSIGGFATTLIHRWTQVPEGEKLQMLQIIEAQSARLRHLIEDLLLLSAVETANVPVRQSAVQVAAALRQIVAELGADVAVDAPPDVVARVDERHFTQIVVNLVSNAQKYGASPIVVSARASDAWVEITVADSGDGVSPDFLPQLFDMFSRGGDGDAVEGSGLGLSIVRGLAEANGGVAWYEPNHPRGACFRVRLPPATDAAPARRRPRVEPRRTRAGSAG